MGPLRRFGIVLATALLLALLPRVPADAAQQYFVSPDGNDRAAGTESSPWGTFQYALSRLRPGDVLVARGGTYREELRNPSISSGAGNAPITVRAYPGERPVIEGLLWLKDPDHWRLEGINVTWGSGSADEHMVKLTDGTGWEYVNSEIWGAQSFAGILVASSGGSEPNGWRIAGNCIHDTGVNNDTNQDHLIYANSGHGGSGVIEGNVMFNAPNGEGIKLGGSSSSSGGASNLTVRYNTIVSTAQSILIGWRSGNNRIEGNLLAGVQANYANIRGYQLSEDGNRASGNLGTGSTRLIMNDGGYERIDDAGGNVHGVDPGFDSGGCNGFRPTSPRARGFGHTAAGTAGPIAPAQGGTFADDDGHIFEAAIERLAGTGITTGCNPPTNDRYCPDRPVTRAQMATFLVRAAGLSGGSEGFADIAGSVHAADIRALAEAGITKGCNPPDNDRYCPDRAVTRGEMAAFLVRTFDP